MALEAWNDFVLQTRSMPPNLSNWDQEHFHSQLNPLMPSSAKDRLNETNDTTECIILPFLNLLNQTYPQNTLTFQEKTVIKCNCPKQITIQKETQNCTLDLPAKKTSIQNLILYYQQIQNLEDYHPAVHPKCKWTHQIMLRIQKCLFVTIKRALADNTINKNAVLLSETIFCGQELHLEAVVCNTGNHFICFAKRQSGNHLNDPSGPSNSQSNEWYLFNDAQISKVSFDDVQNTSAETCTLLLYEKPPSSGLTFERKPFGLPNPKLWCYQNAALQFLYSSYRIQKLLQKVRHLELHDLHKLQIQPQQPLCIAITQAGKPCRNLAKYGAFCGIPAHRRLKKNPT